MKAVFADTSYYLALLNPGDRLHAAAVGWSREMSGPIVITGFVLLEPADGLSEADDRRTFLDLLARLRTDSRVEIIPVSQSLFDEGLALYSDRPDKDWSLTDCISFVAMREHGLTDALTGDRHFEQAGFTVLLK